jgi:ribonuclease VapC
VIVDSSALVAIIRDETDAESISAALSAGSPLRMSAASFLEASIVVDSSRDPLLSARLDDLVKLHRIIIEPFTTTQATQARQAYRDYGKGSGHPAALNFGDCFAYALAREFDEPLLYKGDDFTHTDVRSARA